MRFIDRINKLLTPASVKVCSFCRKSECDCGPLVEGPGPKGAGGIYICHGCAVFAVSIVDQERQGTVEATGDNPRA